MLDSSVLGTTSNAEMSATRDSRLQQACFRWSNRILIVSALAVVYLTLFPFQIHFAFPHPFHRSPFLLGDSVKVLRYSDFFLNVLLFVPFGFGLSLQLCKRGIGRWTGPLVALVVGACVSYTVELLQLYIPDRDSGWEDVISNTTGAVAGSVLFAFCGAAILGGLSKYADSFEGWLSPRRLALLLLIYFAACFGVSVPLQKETRLSNWDTQCSLIVGNDAEGQSPWRGQIFLLQIWNRALPEQTIRLISRQESKDDADAGLLGSYDLTSPPPYQDQRNLLPALAWTTAQPHFLSARAPELGANSWLRTKAPVEDLTREIEKSSQFTVHMLCAPADTQGASGRIVSLSQSSDNINFYLRQQGSDLVFWVRNPLSESGAFLAWTVRGAFESGKARDIFATYDGSDAFMYLDGRRVPRIYRLSPGASLIHAVFLTKTADLDADVIVYETLIFLPAGLLIGLGAGNRSRQKISVVWMLVLGVLLPGVLLEVLLVVVSGRSIWLGNIALSLLFGFAGILLMNADRHGLTYGLGGHSPLVPYRGVELAENDSVHDVPE